MSHWEVMVNTVAEVIVSVHHERVDRPFSYIVPAELDVRVGSRVLVPFGPRRVEGYCIGLSQSDKELCSALKEIEDILDESPLLTAELVDLAAWGSARYLCSRLDFLQAMVPAGVRWTERKWAVYSGPGGAAEPALAYLEQKGPLKLSLWLDKFPALLAGGVLSRLRRQGQVLLESRESKGVQHKTVRMVALTDKGRQAAPMGHKQLLALELLKNRPLSTGTLAAAGVGASTIRGLADKGWAEIQEQTVRRNPISGEDYLPDSAPALTEAQGRALELICSAEAGSKPVLLYGVTGSGKTEVYLQAIAGCVEKGLGSIVLVPEISLTPQMVERFVSRFGERVAVLHSRLSAGERYDEWCRVAGGEALVAVGARSAVFAPFRKLGLVILDEEHEASYKQEETPRYHARDVALWRACRHGAALVLGSATPALESYYKAETGKYLLCPLPERIEKRPLPPVEVVDMRQELKDGHKSIFSRAMTVALQETVQSGKQAILLLNRRGYATFVICRECGHAMRCASCNVSLKYHASNEVLRCHYCDYTEKYPHSCPNCSGRSIRHFGAGTQKVEEELLRQFQGIRTMRLDADTTAKKGSHQKILTAFKRGEADVLVGTQMVAKGLDFPNVTLVGVVAADTAINLPDFRAGERTFQLLTQVAGRAGRGSSGGRVVIQTYTPDHYAVQAAKNHDYEAFYAEECARRKELGYPPFGVLIRLLVSGSEEGPVVDSCSFLSSVLDGAVDFLGPSPCPIEKLRGRFRWQIVVLGAELQPLLGAVEAAAAGFRQSGFSGSVRLSLDVEPQSLL